MKNIQTFHLHIHALLSEIKGNTFLKVVKILIQAMAKNEGGLTQIENRVMRELAMGAGANKVEIWEGAPLSDSDALKKLQNI